MATTAKKIDRLTLGPVSSDAGKAVAINEIRDRLNQLIESINQIITDLNA